MKRALKIILGIVLGLVAIAAVGVFVLTHSEFGRERARRLTLGILRDKVEGEVKIGRIEGSLLGRFALVDVAIADSAGAPFLSTKRITARLATRSLLSKKVIISELRLDDPIITLSKTPNAEWNFARIFPPAPDSIPADTSAGFGDWIELRDVQLVGGTMIVQQPWSPDSVLTGAARDSVIAVTVAGKSRARVAQVAWGYQQTMDFRSIGARIPRIIVAHPDSDAITLRVDQLSMIAAPFHPPNIAVRDFSGDIRVGDDTVTVRNLALRLPGTRATGSLTYLLEPGDALVALKSDTAAFADLRALYPPLPDSGGGSLELDAAIRAVNPGEYVVRNAQLRIGQARIEGELGLVLSTDSTRFHDTDLRFTDFPTSLVGQLVPGVEVRTRGAVTGRARMSGPMERMQVVVDATFDPERDAPFHVVARGGVGYDTAITADRLNVRVDALPVSFLRQFVSDTLPLGGTLFADALVSGSSATRMAGRFNVRHSEKGAVSRVSGEGSIAPGDDMRMDVDLRFAPVSIELAQRFMPGTDVQGEITGTARLRGTPSDLAVRADLTLPSGTLVADGRVKSAGARPVYSANVTLHEVDVHAIAPSLPTTSLNGLATISGEGSDPATLTARATANFRDFVFDSTRFLEAVAFADARGGQVTVDTLRLRTDFGTVTAGGTFGLAEGHDGKLTYRVDVESLAGLQRWIATGDTALVAARPGVRQRLAAAAARGDTVARIPEPTNAAELAAAIAAEGQPARRRGARTAVPDVPPIAADSVSGSFRVTGEMTGNVKRLAARGTATTAGIVWAGSEIGRGKIDFTVADGLTPQATITAIAGVDSLRVAGFAFDSTHLTATYSDGKGDAEIAIFPGDTAEYRLKAGYTVRTNEGEVRLSDVSLQLDSATWVSTRPSVISWKGRGIDIDSLELRTREGGGRIFVDGEVPDVDPGTLVIAVDSLRIAPWLTLLQSDIPANGITAFRGRIEGTRQAPRIEGTLALEQATYDGVPFPQLHTTFKYDARVLTLTGDISRETGTRLAQISGKLPIDLSLGDSVETRLIEAPLVLDVQGDSIPLAPLQQLTDAVTAIDGRAYGAFGIRGTWEKPKIEGELGVDLMRVGLAATGVTYRNTVAHVHMSGDTLVIDSLVARNEGTIRGGGSVVLASLTRPVLNLRLDANDALVLDDEYGELYASSRITVTGPLDTLAVGGTANITRGVVYIPDPESQKLISTGDPAILAVVDSATAQELDIAPAQSDIVKNMSVDVTLTVDRGTWARSSEANIEFYGDLGVELDPASQELALTGALFTDQGDYIFLGRRFVVSRGSVRFTGSPVINPVLQVLATYEVRQAGRAPLDIRVIIGGTLDRPQLSLESSAQPTLSQSDLISFLAFGRSSSSLLAFQGSGLEGGGAGGSSLAGNVAKLAKRQLASIALGALVDEVKSDLTEATRADVLNITPAELPVDVTLGAFATLLRGTEIEIGKYVDRRTFVLAKVRPTLTIPGALIERRFGSNLRLRTSFETRFQPQVPSLTTGIKVETLKVIGAILTWRLGW